MLESRNKPQLLAQSYFNNINVAQPNAMGQNQKLDITNFLTQVNNYVPIDNMIEMYILRSGYTYTTTGSSTLKAFRNVDNDMSCSDGGYQWTKTGIRPFSGLRLQNLNFFYRNRGAESGFTVIQDVVITGSWADSVGTPTLWNNGQGNNSIHHFSSYFYKDPIFGSNWHSAGYGNANNVFFYGPNSFAPYNGIKHMPDSGQVVHSYSFAGTGTSVLHCFNGLKWGTGDSSNSLATEPYGVTGVIDLKAQISNLYLFSNASYHAYDSVPSIYYEYQPLCSFGMFFSSGLSPYQHSGVHQAYLNTIGANK